MGLSDSGCIGASRAKIEAGLDLAPDEKGAAHSILATVSPTRVPIQFIISA